MKRETFRLIYDTYQEALKESHNILQIAENFYTRLNKLEVCDEDSKVFDAFIDGVRGCVQIRKKTFTITNFITQVNIVLMYIIHWLNSASDMDYDVNLYSRRKALSSDLRKTLEKSIECPDISPNIRDRFGLRCVLLNESPEYIYVLFDAIVGILGGKNRKMKQTFVEWYENNHYFTPVDKALIRGVLEVPFYVDFVKDYIKTPKDNGYQTLQFTMAVAVYSDVLPGCQFEIQLRNEEMDENAKNGDASHDDYRDNQELQKVFVVEDFSKLNIPGFDEKVDKDGIDSAKLIFDRRISKTLVP